jgi:hypothetical protein
MNRNRSYGPRTSSPFWCARYQCRLDVGDRTGDAMAALARDERLWLHDRPTGRGRTPPRWADALPRPAICPVLAAAARWWRRLAGVGRAPAGDAPR